MGTDLRDLAIQWDGMETELPTAATWLNEEQDTRPQVDEHTAYTVSDSQTTQATVDALGAGSDG